MKEMSVYGLTSSRQESVESAVRVPVNSGKDGEQ